jgi:hypothetical protein
VSATPPFDEALAGFLALIHDQGLSTDLAWVFREEVTNCRLTYWVRDPIPAANADLARQYYDQGRQHGLGVTLEVVGQAVGRTICHVWFPEEENEASYAMQRPLKLLVANPPANMIPIRSKALWHVLRALNRWRRCVTFSAHIPTRAAVGR